MNIFFYTLSRTDIRKGGYNLNKIELFNQVSFIEMMYNQQREDYLDFHRNMLDQLGESKERVIRSVATTAIFNMTEELGEEEAQIRKVFDVDAMKALSSYSRYNPFVWLKRYNRELKSFQKENRERINQFKLLLKLINEIEQIARGMKINKRGQKRLEMLTLVKENIHYLLNNLFGVIDLDGLHEALQSMFLVGWKMDKNNFLSLLSLNRDLHYWDGSPNQTMQQIAELPDEIDYPAFTKAIFIEKIEHDQDCYLFDLHLHGVMKKMDENKELSGKMFDKLQETVGPIPTYTAQIDEFGQVQSVVPNKPALKIVE